MTLDDGIEDMVREIREGRFGSYKQPIYSNVAMLRGVVDTVANRAG